MKSISTIFCVILLFCVSNLIGQDLPKDGAILVIKEKSFNLKPGIKLTTNVELIKSKRYQKAKFGGLTARTPKGVTISFEKNTENNDLYSMTLLADETISNESYMIIIKGDGHNSHKLRGTTIKVNLGQDQVVTANQ